MWNNSGQLKKMQLQQGQHSMSRKDINKTLDSFKTRSDCSCFSPVQADQPFKLKVETPGFFKISILPHRYFFLKIKIDFCQ